MSQRDSIVLVHLSDIHFQRWRLDGSSYDVDADVRNELENDLTSLCPRVGRVTGIVVTGDVAYAADPREYDAALKWLARLCEKVDCPREAVSTTPGNHDIDRHTTDGYVVSVVQAGLRKDPGSLARLLADDTGARTLFEPLKSYNEFAAAFRCDFGPGQLVWHNNLPLNDGSTLRLCGLNSTPTSSRLDDPNRRLLVLGDISHRVPRESGVTYLSLCHHPPDWLIDGDSAEDLFTNRVHVQLFGHKHAQRVRLIGTMLRIVAGATHPDRGEKNWEPRYNVLSMKVIGDASQRRLEVLVFAREWKPDLLRFVADVPESGQEHSRWEIPLSSWTPEVKGSQASGAAGTTRSNGPTMDPSRRLTYRFLTLPHHKRIEVAQALGLIADDDGGLPDRELLARFLARATERRRLADLWSEVERRHTDPVLDPNPFAGR